MDATSLILRADDFGLSHTVNQAICEAFEIGVLTCASLQVTGPWVAEAAALAQQYSEWEIGLQLNLCCRTAGSRWGPILGAQAVPSLVEPMGTFPASIPQTASAEDIARELTAQAERIRAWGITPAYLEYDGEPHPAVEASLHRLSEDLGVPTRKPAWGIQQLFLPAHVEDSLESVLREVLVALKPGVYLWVTHPAHDAPDTWAMWSESQTVPLRKAEARLLCSPALRHLLEQRQIERIGFRECVEERLGMTSELE
jgi:predicted glycoside hydrolase/deacetylase ChbG (UPF0249 family)